MIYLAAGMMLFPILTERLLNGSRGALWPTAVLGGYAGLFMLLNPIALVSCGAWLAVSPARRRTASRRFWLVLVGAAALVLAPWFVRNYRCFRSVFFVRDNLGLELWVFNAAPAGRHPTSNPEEAALIRELGEVQYMHWRLGQALDWIGSHPAAFLSLTGKRIAGFWFPHAYAYGWGIGIFTVLGWCGLLVLRRSPGRAYSLLVFSTYPLMYYVTAASARYRAPILWLSLLGGAQFLLWSGERLGRLVRRGTQVPEATGSARGGPETAALRGKSPRRGEG